MTSLDWTSASVAIATSGRLRTTTSMYKIPQDEFDRQDKIKKSKGGFKRAVRQIQHARLWYRGRQEKSPRTMIAEDNDWSSSKVPLLSDLCLAHISNNFENHAEIMNKLLLKDQVKVASKISTNLPLKLAAQFINDEDYWKHRCRKRWKACHPSNHGNSWKRMYLECNLQEIIEMFVPGTTDDKELYDTLAFSAIFVKKLDIRQLLPPAEIAHKDSMLNTDESLEKEEEEKKDFNSDGSYHLDLEPVLKKLHNLEELRINYGLHGCGLNFEWDSFVFTTMDCLQLARAVACLKTLKVLHLCCNNVDDEKVRILIANILDHPSLMGLDLSHNKIGDHGTRAIGKFLNKHCQLVWLNLSNNLIRALGAQAIAHALTRNNTLEYLNLKLNAIGDEGGEAICQALFKNSTLSELNLSTNDIREHTADILAKVIQHNSTLTSIDLSNNNLGSHSAEQLREGMEKNTTMLEMDMRGTACDRESDYIIKQILSNNQCAARMAKKQSHVRDGSVVDQCDRESDYIIRDPEQ